MPMFQTLAVRVGPLCRPLRQHSQPTPARRQAGAAHIDLGGAIELGNAIQASLELLKCVGVSQRCGTAGAQLLTTTSSGHPRAVESSMAPREPPLRTSVQHPPQQYPTSRPLPPQPTRGAESPCRQRLRAALRSRRPFRSPPAAAVVAELR